MKIKKTVLKSIIESVIREQPEDFSFNRKEDFKMAYKSIVEITMSAYWAKSVMFLMSKALAALFGRAVAQGSFSMLEISEAANRILSSGKFLSAVDQITKNALRQSPAYQKSSSFAKKTAETSMHKIMKAALSAFIGSELSFVMMYELSSVSQPFAAAIEDIATNDADPKDPGRRADPQVITVDDVEKTQAAIKSLDLLRTAHHAWEFVIKFVGLTHRHENPHFEGIIDMTDFGGIDEEDYFGFAYEGATPF